MTSNSKFVLEPMRKLVHHIPGSPLDIANESQEWGDGHLLNWEDAGKGVIFVDHPRELGFVDANIKHSDTNTFLVTTNRNEFYGKMLSRAGERVIWLKQQMQVAVEGRPLLSPRALSRLSRKTPSHTT